MTLLRLLFSTKIVIIVFLQPETYFKTCCLGLEFTTGGVAKAHGANQRVLKKISNFIVPSL